MIMFQNPEAINNIIDFFYQIRAKYFCTAENVLIKVKKGGQ